MTDALEVLYTTRAMRRLKSDPVPDAVIARIIDAGVRAPSPGTAEAQPWRFVAITDRATMAEFGTLWRSARDVVLEQVPNLYPSQKQAASSNHLYQYFDEVPLLILGYGLDGIGANTVVQACWSMCLAARALGVGATYTTLLNRVHDGVNRIIGVPPDVSLKLYAALPMGYPLGRWGIAPRQPAHEVTFANRWGNSPAWTAEPPRSDL